MGFKKTVAASVAFSVVFGNSAFAEEDIFSALLGELSKPPAQASATPASNPA